MKLRFVIPIWPVLASVLFHSIVVMLLPLTLHPASWLFWKEERLVVRLVSPGSRKEVPASREGHVELGEYLERQEVETTAPDFFGTGNISSTIVDPEEGYLPQEWLSRTAVPEDDIDLQDIPPPGVGAFHMLVWINSRGEVTRVDLEETDVPAWFTQQVVERFEKAKFKPGLRDKKPVACIMRVEVNY